MRRAQHILGWTLCVGALSAMGCSSDDDVATTPDEGGLTDTGVGAETGTDSGVVPTDDGGGDAGSTLYTRLGGNTGIVSFIDDLVAAETADPQIAPFFADNAAGKAGHPTVAQIKACLVLQLSSGPVSGGPAVYPGPVVGGFTCRSMASAHAGLHIPGATFDKFIAIAAGLAKTKGVATADIGTLGAVLNGTKSDIVDGDASVPATDGGKDGATEGAASDATVTDAADGG